MNRILQDGGHGYENIFSNYLSALENYTPSFGYQEENIDNEVDEFIQNLANSDQFSDNSYSDFDYNISNFSQRLDEKLSELESRLMWLDMGSFSGDYSGLLGSNETSQYNTDDIRYKQMMAESSGNPNAIGPKTKYGTAKGLYQFIDATWNRYKPSPTASPFNQQDATIARDAYMNDLLSMFDGDIRKALAGYNWGEGNVKKAVQKYGENWDKHLPKETKGYLKKIVGYQYGGDVPQTSHGYEELFSNYMNMLESATQQFYNQQQIQEPLTNEEISEENEFINSLTNRENEEKILTFAQEVQSLEQMYNERLDNINRTIDLLDLGMSDDMQWLFSDDTDFTGTGANLSYNTGNQDPNKVFSLSDKNLNPNIKPLFDQYSSIYGVGNLGTYPSEEHLKRNPKSDHNTGDAIDLETGEPRVDIAENLIKEAKERNIKYIIHNGKIWSQERAKEGWRDYKGSHKHSTHIHVSFNR